MKCQRQERVTVLCRASVERDRTLCVRHIYDLRLEDAIALTELLGHELVGLMRKMRARAPRYATTERGCNAVQKAAHRR